MQRDQRTNLPLIINGGSSTISQNQPTKRQRSHRRTIENRSFAGRFVCDGCLEPSKGVYRQEYSKTSSNRASAQGSDSGNGGITWVCDSCKGGRVRVIRTPEEKEA